jgi:hypothetical protein
MRSAVATAPPERMGWLRFDRTIGLGAHRLGLMIMAAALIWGAIHLARTSDRAA